MLALIPVRDGELPAGAAEVAQECGGRAIVAGPGATGVDAADIVALGHDVTLIELAPYAPASWAAALAPVVANEALVVLPASPDGRDLAPRLAHTLSRPLHAGAVHVTASSVTVSRRGGLELHTYDVHGPTVATLQPGVRGVEPLDGGDREPPRTLVVDTLPQDSDARTLAVHPPDVTTMDLVEARRIAGGGAGLDDASRFEQLARVAAAIGGSMGATRVVTDRGWVAHERQIGTTGVVVDPELYLAFGISGAVQHTSGLGDPRHIVSVNVDAHCPMMQLADLGVVSDANAVLDELERLLVPGDDRAADDPDADDA
jgi:electron transfer flavoprotein alpha subunit